MVVRKNDRGGIVCHHLTANLSDMHSRAIDRPAKQLLKRQKAMLSVEVQTAKDFISPIP
jgi:hypothetical protein